MNEALRSSMRAAGRGAKGGSAPAGARGLDPAGARAFNERLVLSLLRREGALSRPEIAARSGLSAQTVAVIARALERDGLVRSGAPVKGRVGQPSRPLSLAPDGACSFGLKIGRRDAELALADLSGAVIDRRRLAHAAPEPAPILAFLGAASREMLAARPSLAGRVAGVGVAMPFFLGAWGEGDAAARARWDGIDVGAAVEAACGLPAIVENDASAACGAELMFGWGRSAADFLYVFIGWFVGGGLALNGALYRGPRGNAGAIGSLPLAGGRQLIEAASLATLEKARRAAGIDAAGDALGPEDGDWSGPAPEAWIAGAARPLAEAALAAAALLDAPLVVIEGAVPERVKAALVAATEEALAACDLRGLWRPRIAAGRIGPDAKAIGAASLPMLERFLLSGDGARAPAPPA